MEDIARHRWLLVLVAAGTLTGCWWQVEGDHRWPRVTGAEVAVLTGDHPAPWRVEIAPGEGNRWCVQGDFGDPQSAGDLCNQFVGPMGVAANHGFGDLNSYLGPEGHGLIWGSVEGDARQVIVVFADGTRTSAELAVGPFPFAVWAFGYTGSSPARYEALGHDGQRVGLRSAGSTGP